MGGWVTQTVTKFIHSDDKCPSHCPTYSYQKDDQGIVSCVQYQVGQVYQCPGHRNADANRQADFENYGPGSVIHHDQIDTLRNRLTEELAQRKQHNLYVGYTEEAPYRQYIQSNAVVSGDYVLAGQENVINACISGLLSVIDELPDYRIGPKDFHETPVVSGDITEAENLLRLERATLDSYRDCICYADCTGHGLTSYTTTVWCDSYGSTGGDSGWY